MANNIGLFVKDVDSKIPTVWQAGKTWWFDTTDMSLKVWDGAAWITMTGEALYMVAGSVPGVISIGATILIHPVTDAMQIISGATGSRGKVLVAPTSTATFDLRKNGSSFGTMQFAAAATTATFTVASTTSFSPGDYITVIAPSPADLTLADLGFSLRGTR